LGTKRKAIWRPDLKQLAKQPTLFRNCHNILLTVKIGHITANKKFNDAITNSMVHITFNRFYFVKHFINFRIKGVIMNKLILILTLCISSLVSANESSGSAAAKKWLKIVDAGNYKESWQKSDSFFKSQLSQNKWDTALKGIRSPLGEINSRAELEAKEYSTLPGVPEGEYLIIQFQTEFQNKKSATEILTLSRSSGEWLPVGYFIK
jgi:hypothetical protein